MNDKFKPDFEALQTQLLIQQAGGSTVHARLLIHGGPTLDVAQTGDGELWFENNHECEQYITGWLITAEDARAVHGALNGARLRELPLGAPAWMANTLQLVIFNRYAERWHQQRKDAVRAALLGLGEPAPESVMRALSWGDSLATLLGDEALWADWEYERQQRSEAYRRPLEAARIPSWFSVPAGTCGGPGMKGNPGTDRVRRSPDLVDDLSRGPRR